MATQNVTTKKKSTFLLSKKTLLKKKVLFLGSKASLLKKLVLFFYYFFTKILLNYSLIFQTYFWTNSRLCCRMVRFS